MLQVRSAAGVLLAALWSAAHADVTITQLANEGVVISDQGSARVMIDGMVVEPFSIYGGLSEELSSRFYRAEGPFEGIQLALASHQHHDHNQPGPACQFLQQSTGTRFVSSSQVVDLIREKCRQFVSTSPRIRIVGPKDGDSVEIESDGARVTAFPISHGVGKYASLQNFAHLVEIGGLRVLHLGDAAMDSENFSKSGIATLNADVVLIPFWFFQPGPGGDIVERFLQAPHQIAVHIPPREMQLVREELRLHYPSVIVLERTVDQVSFTAAVQPLP